MAVSRLIQRRSRLRINRYGFPNPVRWSSSHSSEIEKPAQAKKRGVPKAERAVAAVSFVNEYMEKNSRLFPKVAHIQNKVGGSWDTVKEIVTNIKATMAGTTRIENCRNVNDPTPAKHSEVSKVNADLYEPDNKTDLCCHHGSSLEAERVQRDENKEGNVEESTGTPVGCLSSLTVNAVSSDVTCMHHPSSLSDQDKLDFTGNVGQQETCTSSTPAERVQQGEDEEGNKEHSTGTAVECLSSTTVDRVSSDITDTHRPSSSFDHDKLNFTGILDQRETSTTGRPSPNSRVKINANFDGPSSPRGLTRLSNFFKVEDSVTVPEANNENKELFSSILSHLKLDKNPQGRSLISPGISKEGNLFNKRPDLLANKSLSSSWENQPGQEMLASREGIEQWNTKASVSVRGKNRDSIHHIYRYLEEPMQKDETNREEINGLKDCIRWNLGGSSTAMCKNELIFPKTDESCEKSELGSQSKSTLHGSKKKERNLSAEYPAIRSENNHDDSSKVLTTDLRTTVAKIISQDFDKATGHSQTSVLTDKEKSHEALEKFPIREEAGEHKAVVKFLPRHAENKDIFLSLKACGDILKVEFSSPEGAFFRDANVYFKKREGLLKALSETDMTLRNANVTVQGDSGEDLTSRISIPSIIGDPDVPAAVVKNPTRTVKIEQLTQEISLHDVVVALQSWGSNVTGFFFGTLDSVAYVEFEEEDDKEAVLARHSIDVLGKRLLVSRIDAPRTTCVRISYHESTLRKEIVKVYTSLGEPMLSRIRRPGILDVQYKIAEWPNMLKILNSLNQTKVNGHKLKAQPATVIPPPILQILWRHPEERIHVKNCVQKLLRNLGGNIVHKANLADLPNFY